MEIRTFLAFGILLASGIDQCLGDYYPSSDYFCRDLARQQIVDIGQLEGMWYLIEKINHREDRQLRVNLTTCPVIHISEDRNPFPTTYNPLYKTYETTYGAGYPHMPQDSLSNRNPNVPGSTFESEQDYLKQQEEYDRRTTYDSDRRKLLNNLYLRRKFAGKRLKLYISDGSSSTEYHLNYNITDAGFWRISESKDVIQENLKHFSGTIQVLKAVGSHLVLTTCQSSRDVKELYTMILSRDSYLDSWDIHSVHSMLITHALKTKYVEKTCNGGVMSTLSLSLVLFTSILYLTVF